MDDGPPRAVAVSDDGQRQESEAGYLILPEPERPLATIFDEGGGNWMIESDDGSRQRIASGAALQIAERTWQIELPVIAEPTLQPGASKIVLRDAIMRFSISADEQHVEIRLIHGDRVLRMPARSHHHLLLALARARLDDRTDGDEPGAGWMLLEDLLDSVDMTEPTCNVYICRARKDLAEAGVLGATDLIQRQPAPRRLRLGVRTVEIVHA